LDSWSFVEISQLTDLSVHEMRRKARTTPKLRYHAWHLPLDQDEVTTAFIVSKVSRGIFVTQKEFRRFGEQNRMNTLTHGWIDDFFEGRTSRFQQMTIDSKS
jgi:hypothetical protein